MEKITPRLGPPTNLRPAGAHKDARRKSRAQIREELKKAQREFMADYRRSADYE